MEFVSAEAFLPTMILRHVNWYLPEMTNVEVRFLNEQTPIRLPGWTYSAFAGEFHGPARADAFDIVSDLITEAAELAISADA